MSRGRLWYIATVKVQPQDGSFIADACFTGASKMVAKSGGPSAGFPPRLPANVQRCATTVRPTRKAAATVVLAKLRARLPAGASMIIRGKRA